MEERDELRSVHLQQFRNRVDKGLAEAVRGEGVDGEAFMHGLIDDLDTSDAKRNALLSRL